MPAENNISTGSYTYILISLSFCGFVCVQRLFWFCVTILVPIIIILNTCTKIFKTDTRTGTKALVINNAPDAKKRRGSQ